MKVYISDQLLLFAGSILLGVCMGLTYDLLRAFRMRFPRYGGWLDGLCCVLCAGAAFFYALRWGGDLRFYILLGGAGGCVLFFCLLSPLLRPVWALWVEVLVHLIRAFLLPVRILEGLCIKIAHYAKNLFLFCRKWVTIWNYKRAVIRIRRERGDAEMAAKETTKKKRPKSAWMTKMLILALLVLFGTQLYRIQGQVKAAEAQQATLAAQVAQQRQVNEALSRDIANGDDPELMQKIAREKLGLVNPGEKVFRDVTN